jgi:hypothetical protein
MSGTGTKLDPRLLRVVITVGSQAFTYEDKGDSLGFAITARGTKYANPIQNECEVSIYNLATQEKNYILTETSPFNANLNIDKTIAVYAGRVSTGLSLVYIGDITNVTVMKPPDVAVTITSATSQKKKSLVGVNALGNLASLSQISSTVAKSLGLQLNFVAQDKNIANYSYSGSLLNQVGKLNDAGGVNAYVDDNSLVVKNYNQPLDNTIAIVNVKTGMIEIPQVTEAGVDVKLLFNNSVKLGGALRLMSEQNPSVNGDYVIYQLAFDLTNREDNFYYTASCVNPAFSGVGITDNSVSTDANDNETDD